MIGKDWFRHLLFMLASGGSQLNEQETPQEISRQAVESSLHSGKSPSCDFMTASLVYVYHCRECSQRYGKSFEIADAFVRNLPKNKTAECFVRIEEDVWCLQLCRTWLQGCQVQKISLPERADDTISNLLERK